MKKLAILSLFFILIFNKSFAFVSGYVGIGGVGVYNSTKGTEDTKTLNASLNLHTGVELSAIITKLALEVFYENDIKKSSTKTSLYGLKGKLFLIDLIFLEPYVFAGIGNLKLQSIGNDTFITGGFGLNSKLFFITLFAEIGYLTSFSSSINLDKVNLTLGLRYYFI